MIETNKSKNINPRECRTCAKCCKWFAYGYNKNLLLSTEEGEQTCFSEIQRFLELKTDKIYVNEYENEFSVVFDYPCENLHFANGIYTCKTYHKNRPLLCERYPYRPNMCEKYDKILNTFKTSNDFLQRVNELKKR